MSAEACVVMSLLHSWVLAYSTLMGCLYVCALLQMCADGGAVSEAALQQLTDAAYTGAVLLEGGYQGWSQVRNLLCLMLSSIVCWQSINLG